MSLRLSVLILALSACTHAPVADEDLSRMPASIPSVDIIGSWEKSCEKIQGNTAGTSVAQVQQQYFDGIGSFTILTYQFSTENCQPTSGTRIQVRRGNYSAASSGTDFGLAKNQYQKQVILKGDHSVPGYQKAPCLLPETSLKNILGNDFSCHDFTGVKNTFEHSTCVVQNESLTCTEEKVTSVFRRIVF